MGLKNVFDKFSFWCIKIINFIFNSNFVYLKRIDLLPFWAKIKFCLEIIFLDSNGVYRHRLNFKNHGKMQILQTLLFMFMFSPVSLSRNFRYLCGRSSVDVRIPDVSVVAYFSWFTDLVYILSWLLVVHCPQTHILLHTVSIHIIACTRKKCLCSRMEYILYTIQ